MGKYKNKMMINNNNNNKIMESITTIPNEKGVKFANKRIILDTKSLLDQVLLIGMAASTQSNNPCRIFYLWLQKNTC